MGSVGPTQVLVAVNGRIRLFDKNGTNPGILDVTDSTFWGSEAGGLDVTDPQVEYDRLMGRWVITELNFDPSNASMVNNRIMVAVSSDSTITPSTTWTFHHFLQNDPNPGPTALFADYDQMGVDQNAIYVECFMDELAAAAGQDPLEFRRKLMTKNPKHLAVLNAVAERAWALAF